MMKKLHRETLAELATAGLLEFIQKQNLQPGDTLPAESILAAEFGVSRQVIREALKSLQGQGIIEVLNGKGAIIKPIDGNALLVFFQRAAQLNHQTVVELIEIRKGIEIQSAMLAAERRTAEELAQMGAIVAKMELVPGQAEAYSELDLELHLAIASATHNAMLFHLSTSIRQVAKDTILEGLRHRQNAAQFERVQELHRLLLADLERGDAQAAGQTMALQFEEAIQALGHKTETDV